MKAGPSPSPTIILVPPKPLSIRRGLEGGGFVSLVESIIGMTS